MHNIEIDLFSDLKNILLDKIITVIAKNSININDKHIKEIETFNFEKLLDVYLNLLDRLLICRKAKVFISKEIKCNTKYQKYKKEIFKLKKLFENGSSIRPFLSDRINNLIYNKSEDSLLLDWGLHHIHFYPTKKRKNKNDNDILFILKQDNNIYFIDIFTHGDFHNYKALEIVHKNWKNVLSLYGLKGITPDILTEDNFKKLRKYNVGYTIGFKDEPDIAYATNIRRIERQRDIDFLCKYIENLQIQIINSTDDIIKEVSNKKNKEIDLLTIKLLINMDKLTFLEINTGVNILFNENNKEFANLLKTFSIIK